MKGPLLFFPLPNEMWVKLQRQTATDGRAFPYPYFYYTNEGLGEVIVGAGLG